MTTVKQPVVVSELQSVAPLDQLPLPPLTWRSAWAAQLVSFALSGWVGDPGATLRKAGEIWRAHYPKPPKQLRLLFPDPYTDGWTGEAVYVNSPRVVREMYNLPTGDLNHEQWKKAFVLVLGSYSPFYRTGRDHSRVRRALAVELAPARVERYRERSVKRLDEMIDQLPLGTPVALHEFYTRFTQDIILRVVFGWDDNNDLEAMRDCLYRASQHYATRRLLGMLTYQLNARIKLRAKGNEGIPGRDDVPLRILRRSYRLRKQADDLLYRKIAELREHPNDSIASRLIEYGTREDPAWTERQLRDIVVTLLVAGHDTSVLAYAWATQHLMHDPGPRKKLIAEALEGRSDRYAQAANTEALRMNAPVIAALPSPLDHDIELVGYRIPRGTLLFLMVSAVHQDEELYPEPTEFRPERWLENRPDRYGFLGFGAGPHRCPGSPFYLVEAGIVLHRMFGRLELEPCRARVDKALFIFGTVSRPRSDTKVIIRSRRAADEVPWYRPGHDDPSTPLNEGLLPLDAEYHQAATGCPYSEVSQQRESSPGAGPFR
ncbi:cytochrome P450 [Mycobacteroides franklinii]|uniref:cytochrome P450 n=1 Tax=Mycobacteroides franklinii TaxID=948102 RepID=UPI0009944443|nr:cytochrome P450 [Mycobacteroides franklinii]